MLVAAPNITEKISLKRWQFIANGVPLNLRTEALFAKICQEQGVQVTQHWRTHYRSSHRDKTDNPTGYCVFDVDKPDVLRNLICRMGEVYLSCRSLPKREKKARNNMYFQFNQGNVLLSDQVDKVSSRPVVPSANLMMSIGNNLSFLRERLHVPYENIGKWLVDICVYKIGSNILHIQRIDVIPNPAARFMIYFYIQTRSVLVAGIILNLLHDQYIDKDQSILMLGEYSPHQERRPVDEETQFRLDVVKTDLRLQIRESAEKIPITLQGQEKLGIVFDEDFKVICVRKETPAEKSGVEIGMHILGMLKDQRFIPAIDADDFKSEIQKEEGSNFRNPYKEYHWILYVENLDGMPRLLSSPTTPLQTD